MGKKIAISQSNYIPWKGYFDFINEVDEFVLYDDVQYTKRDWRNRNRIKTPHGLKWLSIPVSSTRSQCINEIEIADESWNENHWRSIRHLYSKTPHFNDYASEIELLYKEATQRKLSAINHHFLTGITKILDINTPLTWSMDYNAKGNKSERLLSICKQAGADVYVSGPAAKGYLDISLFKNEGIKVQWMDYEGYKSYPQLYEPFEHAVSVIDLLFNTGDKAIHYLKSLNHVAV